jgi:hypothetical protein
MAPEFAFDHFRKRFVRIDPEALRKRNAYESSSEILECLKRQSREVDGYG